MNGATTIIIALIVSVIAPLMVTWSANRARRAEKREDWARQDKVAADAKVAAEAVAAEVKETARVLVHSNKDVAESTKVMTGQLTTLQTWADGAQTAMMQNEFDARESELVMMKLLHTVKPTPESEGRIAGLTELVASLRARLDERLKAAKIVEEQIKSADRRRH